MNVLLSMTVSALCDLMLVLTTSNPQALNEAVLDRMDEFVELKLPKMKERHRILSDSFEDRLRPPQVGIYLSTPFPRRRDSWVEVEGTFEVKAVLCALSSDEMSGSVLGGNLTRCSRVEVNVRREVVESKLQYREIGLSTLQLLGL